MKEIYVLAIQQISAQQPLSAGWMDQPVSRTESYARAADPDFRQYFEPGVTRRMGKILKRALVTSQQVMDASGVSCPDAVITGTGLGCVENTELFLTAMLQEGEGLLKPTHFMQSTHNTVGAQIAIHAHCHSYNTTYAHGGISFEIALLDAFMQLQHGRIRTALVGAHDELTPDYFVILKRSGYLQEGADGFGSETSVAMMLGDRQQTNALCRLRGVETCYGDDVRHALEHFLNASGCRMEDIDAVMTGANGFPDHDALYDEICPCLFAGKPLLRYKHLFGESYTASALGMYAAAMCLHHRRIPAHMLQHQMSEPSTYEHMLLYHRFGRKHHTFILLSGL
ncbi:MAG: beta-ketoacyl synthase chain length factor [Bacteroidales bacterium]|jgi:3-oxoacyl-(acyl-carrier-protein) synthase|nr:beta-ketoacyl synthase chain length factor [Bacteroidales bacterium]